MHGYAWGCALFRDYINFADYISTLIAAPTPDLVGKGGHHPFIRLIRSHNPLTALYAHRRDRWEVEEWGYFHYKSMFGQCLLVD
jgi:hypothetical protein